MQNDQGCFGIPRRQNPPRSEVWLSGSGGNPNNVRYFSSAPIRYVGAAITYNPSTTLGDSFLINETGVYSVYYSDSQAAAAAGSIGVSVNSSNLGVSISSLPASQIVAYAVNPSGNGQPMAISTCILLNAGDIIRPQSNGAQNNSGAIFRITKVA